MILPKEKKYIFLTGATGYLGSNLIPKFIESGYYLKLLVRAKKNNPYLRTIQCLSRLYKNSTKLSEVMKRIEILEGDINKEYLGLSEHTIRSISKEVNDVFHCAGTVSFDEGKQEAVVRNNIEGTKNILFFLNKLQKVHLHYMSTAFVCGQQTGVVKENKLNTTQNFNNVYEKSKCEAEYLVRKWEAQNKRKVTIYRPSVIVGDSKTGQNQSNFGLYGILRITDFTIRSLKTKYKKCSSELKVSRAKFNDSETFFIPLRVIGRNDKTLNLVTIDYVIETITCIFKNKDNIGNTYHITNLQPTRVGLLKNCLCEVLKVSGIRFVFPEDFKKEPMKSWERLFNKNIKIYTPYLLLDEPKFDNTNTQNILKATDVKLSNLNKELITKLMTYSYLTNYGKKQK